jgi:putative tryptophan/tyrosine transport system substrate-binding protein
MRRREFLAALCAALSWPPSGQARELMPVVGCLINDSPNRSDWILVPFRQGLAETGFVEGTNVALEYRWGDGHNERMPALAAELVDLHVSVVAILGGGSGALPAKKLTKTIPIVFLTGGDAVELGLVTSLNKPDANLTGVSGVANSLATKQLELLAEFAAKSAPFGLLANPLSPNAHNLVRDIEAAARTMGRDLLVFTAGDARELDAAFAEIANDHVGGLVVPENGFFQQQRGRIATLAALDHLPTIYNNRESVVAGGLLSYGVNFADVFRQLGIYTGKILRGTKPSELPVFQPSKFQFVINMKTAKTLGIDVRPELIAEADEVIE